jgi:DNA polymerase III subunit delta'
MIFADIPGLQDTKEKLYRTIESGKIAHAQMFAGPEGSGNLALAIGYAALLNCTSRTEGDACGVCPSCTKINKLIHPDVHYIFPVSATQKVTGKDVISDSFIESWRQFVTQFPYGGPTEWSTVYGGENKQLNISREESRNILRKLSLKSFEGEYKVMIIWLAEYMHPSAANALLKILEEPPEKTVFLMVTYDPEQIISTILSRVQLLKIRPFNKNEITDYLVKYYNVNEGKAAQLANMSSGDMNEAVKMIHEAEDDTHGLFQEWMRECFGANYPKLVRRAENFSTNNKINQKGLFQYGMSILRDSLLVQNEGGELIHSFDKAFTEKFSQTLDLSKLEKLYHLLNTAFYHLERNGNPKIIFLDTSLQITSVFRN